MFQSEALRVEHGKAVVMLGGDDDVFLAGILGDRDPLVGVELDGVEFLGELLVLGHGDLAGAHDPFADAADGLPL